ncbi:MAG: Crp/Fnr family transcriptional regulator [Rugosibacter sp.]|nr:Crp/Fnr family transcriptional regulator [Rugosibacter sp.]
MSNNIEQIITHLPLFQMLDPEQRAQLLLGIHSCHLKKGEFLFNAGEPPSGLYIVVFGQIKLAVQSVQGEEKVVEIIGPQQSFGEAVMFLDRPYPVTAEALADSLLLHVARDQINTMLAQDVSFARKMLAGMSMRLHSLIQDVESYSLRSSTQRVIGYLLQQCPATDGSSETFGQVEFILPASKQVIASRLNLSPETLSRIFAELSRAGLINVDGRTVKVSAVTQLREYGL